MEYIPIELSEQILSNVGVDDLLNCSKVSSVWRSRANNNKIWKYYCQKNLFTVSTMEKYKEAMFHKYGYIPTSTNLEPLCFWRIVYSVNKDLMKFWCHGVVTTTAFQMSPQVYCLDCDETNLVSGHENGTIFIWRIELLKSPKNTIGRYEDCLLKGTPVTGVGVCNEYVVVVQKQLLQIYKFDDSDIDLIGCWSYELNKSNINLITQAKLLGKNFDHWYKECIRNYDVYPSRRMKFLSYNGLCFSTVGGTDTIDIWNMENGKPKACLAGFNKVRKILKCNGQVYVVSGNNPTIVSRYDWDKNESCRVISVCGLKRIVFGPVYTLAFPHPSDTKMNMLWAWNRSYSLVRTKVLSSSIVSALAPELVLYTENSFVNVWNPEKDTILKTFPVGASVGFMMHAHANIIVLFMNYSLDVWDFLKGKRISRLYSRLEWNGDFRELLWLNPVAIVAGGVRYKLQLLEYFCK